MDLERQTDTTLYLPQELCDAITDAFFEDIETLKALCHVCRALRSRARQHLFREAVIRPSGPIQPAANRCSPSSTSEQVFELISAAPELASYVKTLKIKDNYPYPTHRSLTNEPYYAPCEWMAKEQTFKAILTRLVNVENLHLEGGNLLINDFLGPTLVPLKNIFKSPQLRELHITRTMGPHIMMLASWLGPTSYLQRLTFLQDLRMDEQTEGLVQMLVDDKFPFECLEYLHIGPETALQLSRWVTSSPSTHLALHNLTTLIIANSGKATQAADWRCVNNILDVVGELDFLQLYMSESEYTSSSSISNGLIRYPTAPDERPDLNVGQVKTVSIVTKPDSLFHCIHTWLRVLQNLSKQIEGNTAAEANQRDPVLQTLEFNVLESDTFDRAAFISNILFASAFIRTVDLRQLKIVLYHGKSDTAESIIPTSDSCRNFPKEVIVAYRPES
jgi:hypothetical protein